jgi:hypothetical protein
MAQSDRINFRCSTALRRVLEEAAKRSNISLSEQARISLERLYQVDKPEIWLPEVLRNKRRQN